MAKLTAEHFKAEAAKADPLRATFNIAGPGALSGLALADHKLQEHQLSRNGNASLLRTNNVSPDKAVQDKNQQQNKQDKNWQDWLLRQTLNDQVQGIRDHIAGLMALAKYYEELAASEQKIIDENTARMQHNSNFIGLVESLDAQYKRDGKLDEEDISKLKEELRARGKKIDDNIPLKRLMDMARQEKDAANGKNKELEDQNKIHEQKKQGWIDNAQKARTEAENKTSQLNEVINDKSLSDDERATKISELIKGLDKGLLSEIKAFGPELAPYIQKEVEAQESGKNQLFDEFAIEENEEIEPKKTSVSAFNKASNGNVQNTEYQLAKKDENPLKEKPAFSVNMPANF
jgi:hypothetical protein